MEPTKVTTGADLRAERERVEATQHDLARLMGSTQQHVSVIESKAIVKAKVARRYREAVYGYTTGERAAS